MCGSGVCLGIFTFNITNKDLRWSRARLAPSCLLNSASIEINYSYYLTTGRTYCFWDYTCFYHTFFYILLTLVDIVCNFFLFQERNEVLFLDEEALILRYAQHHTHFLLHPSSMFCGKEAANICFGASH